MNQQIAIPTEIRPEEISREKSLGGAIELCAKAAGFELDKTLQTALEVDKAQFSRWHSGAEGIIWPKLEKLMNACGNDAPLLWMLYQRGYDLCSLRKRETEYQQRVRELEEELAEERKKREHNEEMLQKIFTGRAV